jgi:hypothetical protein
MMAKMFYTLEETKSTLGKSDEEIKQLTREGRLREFRDGPRLMFKADQVETLKGEFGETTDQINLGPSDTGAPIGLVDSRSGSSPVISLSDSAGGTPSPGSLKEDTALAADLGLSGSIGLSGSVGGMPSPARPGGSGSGLSGLSGSAAGGSGSKGGINVLGEDAGADPMAQTAINPALADQLNIEGMGSGSGLLDLTRESDNTSLGAVLDEIPAGSRVAETVGATTPGFASGLAAMTPTSTRVVTPPQYVEAKDALAPAIGGMSLFAALFALLGILALGGGVLNVKPGLLETFNQGLLVLAGIGIGVAVVGFVGGLVIGKVRG